MAESSKGKVVADCPDCGARVSLKETAKIGTIVKCPECGERLEVISLKPPELEYAYEEEEDEDV